VASRVFANQTRTHLMFVAVAIILFVAAEFLIGWWALPVVGLILGLVGAHRKAIGVTVAGAALAAWVILFAWTAMQGNLGTFMQALAASMKVKPVQLFSVIAVLPALLAGPAARLGAALRPESAPKVPAGTALGA
jgi:hypothetical protein